MASLRILLLSAVALSVPVPARAEWKAIETVVTYPVTGKTGAEIYASIGERGPKAGSGRAIAVTTFKLTWTRKYVPKDGACTLTVARPKLIVTYTLPKPVGPLPPSLKERWESFIAGVRAHERVHGADIEAMVREIEAVSVGLSAPADPDCRKVRADLQTKLAALSAAQRRKSRDFDRVEMGAGGTIERLVLALVNGP